MSDRKEARILYLTDHDASGNYFAKLIAASLLNPPKPGTVNHVSIAHDAWCDLLAGKGPCNCDPQVQILGREQ
jgi:hypothetical protein